MEFISAYLGSIVVGIVLLALVVLVIMKMYKDKKKGRSSCGGGCANCPSAGMCHRKEARPVKPMTGRNRK